MFEPTEWPARRLSIEEVSGLPPVTDPQVGDRVVIHSRGAWREALVEKIGRTKVTVVYTTEGAIRDANKIAGFTTPEYKRREADQWDAKRTDPGSAWYGDNRLIEWAEKARASADKLEATPIADRWTLYLNETRKAVPFAETFQVADPRPGNPEPFGPDALIADGPM